MQPRTERRTDVLISSNKGNSTGSFVGSPHVSMTMAGKVNAVTFCVTLLQVRQRNKIKQLAAMIGCLLDCHLCLCCRAWPDRSACGRSAILCTRTREPMMSPNKEPQASSRLLCTTARAGLLSRMGGSGCPPLPARRAPRRAGGRCRAPSCSGRRRSPPAAPPAADPSSPRPSHCCRRTASRTRGC